MATEWHATWHALYRRARRLPLVGHDVTARHVCSPPTHRWRRAARAGIGGAALGLVGATAILAAPCFAWTAPELRTAEDAAGSEAIPTAEVSFASPRLFAVLMEPSETLRRLYTTGDIIPSVTGPGGEYQILQIEPGGVRIGGRLGGKAIWVPLDGVIPGGAGWRVTWTPKLQTVEYRYVRASGPLDTEPRLLELRHDRAYLEVDIPPTAATTSPVGAAARTTPTSAAPSGGVGRTFENTLLGHVRVKPTADDSYEISAADLNAAMEQRAELIMEAWPKIWPSGYSPGGVSLDIQSPIADGTLGPRGFRVTSPNLAEQGGVQVGDLIVGVNGQPVNGFSDVYRVYSQLQRDPDLSVIQLDLVRQGRHVTKTYRIR